MQFFLTNLPCPDSRAGRCVSGRCRGVDININRGIGRSCICRNSGQISARRDTSAAASYLKLCTLGIELRRVCLKQCKQLMSNEIVSRREILGDGARPRKFGIHDSCPPTSACERWRCHAHLVDLEPACPLPIAARETGTAGVHPDHYWALLVRPLSPFRGDFAAGRDVCHEGCRGPAVAGHCCVCDGQDRIVAGPLTLNRWRTARRAESLISWVRSPTDNIACNGSMGGSLSYQKRSN